MWEQQYKSYAEWHVKPDCYNLAFLDGHIAFVKIRRAYYVTDDYSVIPFKDLYRLGISGPGRMTINSSRLISPAAKIR